MPLSLRFSAVSDVGRTRKKNDDSGYVGPHLVMVADGMGGAPAGDVASAVAVQTVSRLDAPPPDDLLEALAGAVHRANDRLAELIEDDSALEGMGTTLTAVLFDGQHIGVAHLGDSRGYLWHDGELLRLSRDHTWVQSLIDEGRISEDDAKVHSHRSLLLKVLDGRHDNDPDLDVYDVEAGDRILLCSDGLSGFVDHERLQRVVSIGTADSVTHELLQLALEASSTDNITVVVADVVDEPADEAVEPVVVGAAADGPPKVHGGLRTWAQRDDNLSSEHLLDPDLDPEELRYAPRGPQRYRWLKRGVLLVVVVAIAALLVKVSYDWTQRQYYVATDGDQVAIYQGIQAELPGISLHHVYETEGISIDNLSSYRRGTVIEGLDADDLDHAHRIVAQLREMAATCANQAASSAPTTTRRTHASATGRTGNISTGPGRTTQPNGPATRQGRTTTRPGGTATTTTGPTPTRRPVGSGRPSTTARSATSASPSTGGSEAPSPGECAGATAQTGGTR